VEGKPRLLVIDDEEVVCRSCARILEHHGLQVDTCTDAREGLRRARGGQYGLVVLDILMPDVAGLDLLRDLRETHPDLPVIIITAHASLSHAAEALRLHASSLVAKPFTPSELVEAVGRVVPLGPAQGGAGHAPGGSVSSAAGAWVAASGEVLFLDDGWSQVGVDGTVRVGAFLGRVEGRVVEAARGPQPGEVLHLGLPLVEFSVTGGRRHVVPSPVTGVVTEVNTHLLQHPDTAWGDPCRLGWVARVRRRAGSKDRTAGQPRRVVAHVPPGERGLGVRETLARMGCAVTEVLSAEAVPHALRSSRAPLLVLDGLLGTEDAGELFRRLREDLSHVRAAVALGPGEAVPPWASPPALTWVVGARGDADLVAVLDAVFRRPRHAAATRPGRALPSSMRAVRVGNRHGQTVTLLCPGELLATSDGPGMEVLRRLADAGVPVRVTLGPGPLSPMEIWTAAHDGDRVLLLQAQGTRRIPGTLTRDPAHALAIHATDAAPRVTTFLVQPSTSNRGLLWFDEQTNDALAEVLVDLMLSPV
jgi:DNA-binding response OmpR family regulator